MKWVFDRAVSQSNFEPSIDNTKVADLVFIDNTVILVELLLVAQLVLEPLQKEPNPWYLKSLGPRTRY